MFWNCLDLRETANEDKVFAFSSRKETIKKIGSSSALATLEWKGLPAGGLPQLRSRVPAIPEGENIRESEGTVPEAPYEPQKNPSPLCSPF